MKMMMCSFVFILSKTLMMKVNIPLKQSAVARPLVFHQKLSHLLSLLHDARDPKILRALLRRRRRTKKLVLKSQKSCKKEEDEEAEEGGGPVCVSVCVCEESGHRRRSWLERERTRRRMERKKNVSNCALRAAEVK